MNHSSAGFNMPYSFRIYMKIKSIQYGKYYDRYAQASVESREEALAPRSRDKRKLRSVMFVFNKVKRK